jgi:branched-chain amino acid aminotransferase
MKWDNAIILNSHDRIADATGTNVFLVSGNTLITPPLSEGPVAGVMRRHLLEKLPLLLPDLSIIEQTVTIDMLKDASEIFLTNSISGIRWVGSFNGKSYTNNLAVDIYQKLLKTIWQ